MKKFLQRAGMPALSESQVEQCLVDPRFANLGERIVQAARMAVVEHLRQGGQFWDQVPLVIGGADHAAGAVDDSYREEHDKKDREAA